MQRPTRTCVAAALLRRPPRRTRLHLPCCRCASAEDTAHSGLRGFSPSVAVAAQPPPCGGPRPPAAGRTGLLYSERVCWQRVFAPHALATRGWPLASSSNTDSHHPAPQDEGQQGEARDWEARLSYAVARQSADEIVLVLAQAASVGLSCEVLVRRWLADSAEVWPVTRLRAILEALTAAATCSSPAQRSSTTPATAVDRVLGSNSSSTVMGNAASPRSADTHCCAPADAVQPLAQLWLTTVMRLLRHHLARSPRTTSADGAARHTHGDGSAERKECQRLLADCQHAAISLAPNAHVALTLASRLLSERGSTASLVGNHGVHAGLELVVDLALAEIGCALRRFSTRTAAHAGAAADPTTPGAATAAATSAQNTVSVETYFLTLLTDLIDARPSSPHSTQRRTQPHAQAGVPMSSAPPAPAPPAPPAPAPPPPPLHAPGSPVTSATPVARAREMRGVPPPPLALIDLWVGDANEIERDVEGPEGGPHRGSLADFQAWYLHCLMATSQYKAVAQLLRRAATRAKDAQWLAHVLPATTHRELLTTMPHTLLQESGVLAQLPALVLTWTHAELPSRVQQAAQSLSVPSDLTRAVTSRMDVFELALLFRAQQRQQRRAAPLAVTSHASLYGRMVEYLLSCCTNATSATQFHTHVRDLQVLFSVANTDALASSLVPGDASLREVMVAQPDPRRTEKVAALVKVFSRCVEFLCESPLLLTEGRATGTGASAADGHAAPTWRQRLTWRRSCQNEVDTAVALGAHLFTDLLLLCSDRSGCLPARAAEPAWRRELRAKVEVRAHKYQLLLSELPHLHLRDTIAALLKAGYLVDAARAGQGLVEGHHIDLHYYPLALLGALHQALQLVDSATHTAASDTAAPSPPSPTHRVALAVKPEVLDKVRALYQRRQRVFGEPAPAAVCDGVVATPAPSSTSVLFAHTPLATAAALTPGHTRVSSTDLVVDSATTRALATMRVAQACGVQDGLTAPPELLSFVHQLLHRSSLVPGGGLAISTAHPAPSTTSAGVWLVKGHSTRVP